MARYYSNANDLITFSRASTATFIGSDGLIQTASVDGPRIDYDPLTGKVKGLLIEEERENLFPSSNDFTTWAENTTSGATTGLRYIQENAAIGPDGQTSAHKLVESTDADQQRIYRAFLGMTANTTPVALPDLSGTNLQIAYDFMGTIGTFRQFAGDIGDDGLEEATS